MLVVTLQQGRPCLGCPPFSPHHTTSLVSHRVQGPAPAGARGVLAHTFFLSLCAAAVSHGVQGPAPAGARGVLAHTFFLSLCAACGGAQRKLTK